METPNTPKGPAAVIGAGLTGRSWAALFLAYGRDVFLYDADSEKAPAAEAEIGKNLEILGENLIPEKAAVRSEPGTLIKARSIEEAAGQAVFIQECVYESYEVKRDVFRRLDSCTPRETILATSSSGLSISRIQEAAGKHPERCLAGHPYNPPHLIPLVEIAPGEKTDSAAMETARMFYLSVGKKPVTLSRDIPGYLANRMSAALWREAISLVLDGVASVEDVDNAISWGPGLRWAVMGPHMIYHLGGGEGGIEYHLEHLGGIKENILADLDEWKQFPPETAEKLSKGLPPAEEIGAYAAKRDRQLMELLKLLQMARKENES